MTDNPTIETSFDSPTSTARSPISYQASNPLASTPKRIRTNERSDRGSFSLFDPFSPGTRSTLGNWPGSFHDAGRNAIRSPSTGREDNLGSLLQTDNLSSAHLRSSNQLLIDLPNQEHIQPSQFRHHDIPGAHEFWSQISLQEACLLRYFIDELACWVRIAPHTNWQLSSLILSKFDICDPERHFSLIVPQRSSKCPVLLSAIYTASARHLCRLEQYRKDGVVEYLGKRLPDLRMETAVRFSVWFKSDNLRI